MSNPKRKEISILLLCLLVGFALRFYTFDQKSLWMDEIYTFNDSRDNLNGQIKFYTENPTYLHPPLFFVLTHLLYPFEKPERDLRIIPLIAGILSVPMIYFLSRLFSSTIAISCTLCLTFMTYHISISQEGRSYSLLMFFAMIGVYFFLKHLQTQKKIYLCWVALIFAILLYCSYTSILFIVFLQILWFYGTGAENNKSPFSSMFILNGLLLLFATPWLTFLASHYKGQPIYDLRTPENPVSLLGILSGIFHDWLPYVTLMTISIILLSIFPFFARTRKNAVVLLSVFMLPIGGLYLYCRLFNITHFVTSKYFISFLPLFLIIIFSSLEAIEVRFRTLKKPVRLKLLFVILLIFSNLVMLPLYYRSEKQNYRDLVNYLKIHLQNGDKVHVGNLMYIGVMLHYFGIYPQKRHYGYPTQKVSQDEFEYGIVLRYRNIKFLITYSKSYWHKYLKDGSRVWIVADNEKAKVIQEHIPCSLKGYFDGSFLNMSRFPMDGSIYLFLWDPKSSNGQGIDMLIK